MKVLLALFILAAGCIGSLAGEIRRGATMTVKANSIWFEQADQLTEWQQKKKTSDQKSFAAYQDEQLHQREAWQFINPVKVKVLGHAPKRRRIYVEFVSPGRMQGTEWFLDDSALAK